MNENFHYIRSVVASCTILKKKRMNELCVEHNHIALRPIDHCGKGKTYLFVSQDHSKEVNHYETCVVGFQVHGNYK